MYKCKDWVVVFQNLEACKCFWACYRHENYRILTVVEKPEIATKE